MLLAKVDDRHQAQCIRHGRLLQQHLVDLAQRILVAIRGKVQDRQFQASYVILVRIDPDDGHLRVAGDPLRGRVGNQTDPRQAGALGRLLRRARRAAGGDRRIVLR